MEAMNNELSHSLKGVCEDLAGYVGREIIPRYRAFDKAHREDHVIMVISQSMKIADKMPELDRDMVFAVAAFHDLGLINGRERHHIDSAVILGEDTFIKQHFSPRQIAVMQEAVEDHRASGKSRPRNDYGLVVADADRFIDAETIIRRTVQYSLANYPELDRKRQYDRAVSHLTEKYGEGGYLKVWLPWSDNAVRLQHLRKIIADKRLIDNYFTRIYKEETSEP